MTCILDPCAQGAIPVIFSNKSFFMPWHAPVAEDFSVLIDPKVFQDPRSPRSIVDLLEAIPAEEIARLQRNIAKAGMRLHYAAPPPESATRDCVVDAYEVIIQNMCRRANVSSRASGKSHHTSRAEHAGTRRP